MVKIIDTDLEDFEGNVFATNGCLLILFWADWCEASNKI